MSLLVTVKTPENPLDVARPWHEIEAKGIRGQHALMFPRFRLLAFHQLAREQPP
jgi:hypothetical protein